MIFALSKNRKIHDQRAREIVELLSGAENGLSTTEIAERIKVSVEMTRRTLRAMARRGEVVSEYVNLACVWRRPKAEPRFDVFQELREAQLALEAAEARVDRAVRAIEGVLEFGDARVSAKAVSLGCVIACRTVRDALDLAAWLRQEHPEIKVEQEGRIVEVTL